MTKGNRPFYQLTTRNGCPTFYTFFDNMDTTDRLHIRVMIYHLNSDEYKKTHLAINTKHGKQSMDANEPLEFMKYFVINHNGNIKTVDMDTLHFVSSGSSTSLTTVLRNLNPEQGESLQILKSTSRLKDGPSLHHGDTTLKRAKLRLETKQNGAITLIFSTYTDPNTRNGVQITIQKNMSKDTMYGALVYATHPKYIRLKNATTLPKIPNKKLIEKMKNSKYWIIDETPKKYMNKKNKDLILIPRNLKKAHIDKY